MALAEIAKIASKSGESLVVAQFAPLRLFLLWPSGFVHRDGRPSPIIASILEREPNTHGNALLRYHLECLGQIQTDRYHEEQYLCPYCHFFEDGSLSLDGVSPLKFVGKRPDIKLLVELLADAKSSCTRIEETCLLEQIVEQAVRCSAHSAEIVGFASSYLDTDLCTVAQKLTTALKVSMITKLTLILLWHWQETHGELELAD
ncbi:uncharacterized protein LOC110812753 [Carica papaya]|uniref:uncharacterized protein LOC110812753 n=1 Tax=Carica papaya TaxID=3649 RepID=UPI000B8C883A|nr:uncharacterized protein LOC110812753 [Carica papaya]